MVSVQLPSEESSSMAPSMPNEVPERLSFPAAEEGVLSYWKEIDAFRKSNELSEGRPVYSFYDGPPFATGLPHYGHLLAGTIKDVVTRFAYQTGHHVPRRFGWDCHGLPIEFEIEKMLGIKSSEDVKKYGIDNYNRECRSIVMRFAKEWETIVSRIGRWIDFENDYKTLDTSFMESIWWVFKTLHEKGLVYRGFRVMPYSFGCTTPLSNFEAKMSYEDVNDPAVTVSFPVIGAEEPVAFVAWTTTPWTLPSNLALCVNPKMTYVYVTDLDAGKKYIIAEKRLSQLFKIPKKKNSKEKLGFEVTKKVKGLELVGMRYEPLFNYFYDEYKERGFKVLSDDYVTDADGTGIVHQAPAFGEDDYRVCIASGVIDLGEGLPCPLDDDCKFVTPVSDFLGQNVKAADKDIVAHLKENGRLVRNGSINHRYPFCWRSDTPLIQRAVPSWFVSVEKIKERLIANNKATRWVPEFVQHNRFGNWLENARDWNVSRNRYWGTPLPIWRDEESGEIHVVGSVKELEELSGVSGITDLHRDSIDEIEIKSPKTGKTLRRVTEVFDCWFESGSMPYASAHYPFGEESKKTFGDCFPADFIAEGLDQTRGWFYTLMVLSTALFDKPAFQNCVVNGLVLAEDGKKMSKRLKNYPDPVHVINAHGADALRLYLINSPVVRAEPLRFREDGVRDVVKEVMLPWFNSLRFLVQNARSLSVKSGNPVTVDDAVKYAAHKNQMDRWIESSLGSLVAYVRTEMEAYRLYTVVPRLLTFIRSLTEWYIRLNRPRLKGASSEEEQRVALGTLAHVLLSLSRLMAPFTPFFADYAFQILKPMAPIELAMDCVHFLMLPSSDTAAVDKSFEEAVEHMQEAIGLGRIAREQRGIQVKQPLKEATIVHRDQTVLDAVKSLEEYVRTELNVRELHYSTNEVQYMLLKADADGKVLGKKLGKDFKNVHTAVRALTPEDVKSFEQAGELEVCGHKIQISEVNITRELRPEFQSDENLHFKSSPTGLLLALNTVKDDDLLQEGLARELINRVQKLRKQAQLDPEDKIEVFVDTEDENICTVMTSKVKVFRSLLNVPAPLESKHLPKDAVVIANESVDPISGSPLKIVLVRAALCPSVGAIAKEVDGNVDAAKAIAMLVRSRTPKALGLEGGATSFKTGVVYGEESKFECTLTLGTQVFSSTAERVACGAPP